MSHIDHIEDVYSKRPISTDMYFNPSNEHEDNIDNMQIQPDDDDDALWLQNDNYNEQYSDDSFNVIKLEDENEILKDKIIKLEYENEILKDNNYNILINENNKYQNEIKLYEQNIDDLQKKYEDLTNKTSKEHKEHQMIIKKFNDIKETEGQQLQIKIDSQEQRIDQLQQSLELKDNEIQNLKNENEILKDKIQETNDNFDQFKILYNELDNNYNILINENNKYQNKIKLYEQNIDDLRKKYEDLKNKTSKEHKEHQMIIKKFNDTKETEYININEVKELLLKYGCQTVISDKKPNKSLIRAVLQRHVLEEILKQSDFYFTCSSSWDEDNVENMVVEICSFPLIFKTSDSDDFKVFTPAKVLLRQENSMNAENNDDDNVSIFEQTKQTLLNVMGRDGNSGSSGSKLSQFMQQMKLK
uniref:Uncharacterized protein n=1 Tax=Rhizophagus irregularis (strain DAOM 181602 / DAOM 197198 / MUCL 43194) TaxID=747089 RepID=U9TUD4_RHIID